MPGQPKRKAAQAADLSDLALTLAQAIFVEAPHRCGKPNRLPANDPLGRAWQDAITAALRCEQHLQHVEARLRQKAASQATDTPPPDADAE